MKKLTDFKDSVFRRGAIFRVAAKYPYEDVVDFMLVEVPEAPSGWGMMVATGYSAGHTFQHLPSEVLAKGTRMVSAKWLKDNWEMWIYPPCPVDKVWVIEGYDIPTLPQ